MELVKYYNLTTAWSRDSNLLFCFHSRKTEGRQSSKKLWSVARRGLILLIKIYLLFFQLLVIVVQKKGTKAMIPSPDKREQCSTLSSVIAIKVTIPWTLLIRIDIKTMSHWERCFNIAWSFFIYIYIFYTEIVCACDQSGSELTQVWM